MKSQTRGIITLIAGIASLIIGWLPLIGMPVPLFTLIFGVASYRRMGSSDAPEKGLVTAGLAMALIILIFNIVLTIVMGVRALALFT